MEILAKVFESFAWKTLMGNKQLAYGLGPMLSYSLTYLTMACFLEFLTAQPFMDKYMIRYSASVSRSTALEKTRKVASFSAQLSNVLSNLFGIGGLISGAVIYVVAFIIGGLEAPITLLPPSASEAVMQVIITEFFGDFLLYWGHRIQHDIAYLYEISHSFHHTLETPTPLGTGYVKTLDGILQHALPVAILMVTVRPHPLTLYFYIICRISESVWNHSGIDHQIVDIITLKFLPLRAPIAHHDAHHKYSSYSKNAKNFGECFWIWDYAFGTYSAYRNVKANSIGKDNKE